MADILISECGLPELVPAEYGGTADVQEGVITAEQYEQYIGEPCAVGETV